MRQADLMAAFGPASLAAEAVGKPELGPPFAEEVFDHGLLAMRIDDEHGVQTVMEHPQPPVGFSNANAGLVAGQRRARKQPRLDRARLSRESRAAVVEDGDERALAD